jgi:hypothetical protein
VKISSLGDSPVGESVSAILWIVPVLSVLLAHLAVHFSLGRGELGAFVKTTGAAANTTWGPPSQIARNPLFRLTGSM